MTKVRAKAIDQKKETLIMAMEAFIVSGLTFWLISSGILHGI